MMKAEAMGFHVIAVDIGHAKLARARTLDADMAINAKSVDPAGRIVTSTATPRPRECRA